jgi:hypothetical protein
VEREDGWHVHPSHEYVTASLAELASSGEFYFSGVPSLESPRGWEVVVGVVAEVYARSHKVPDEGVA